MLIASDRFYGKMILGNVASHGFVKYASYIFTENIAQTSFLHYERFKNAFQCFPSSPLSSMRILLCFSSSIMSDVSQVTLEVPQRFIG